MYLGLIGMESIEKFSMFLSQLSARAGEAWEVLVVSC